MPSISVQAAGVDEIETSRDKEGKEVNVFIFNDVVDLFALYGIIRLGRVMWNRHQRVSK